MRSELQQRWEFFVFAACRPLCCLKGGDGGGVKAEVGYLAIIMTVLPSLFAQ